MMTAIEGWPMMAILNFKMSDVNFSTTKAVNVV